MYKEDAFMIFVAVILIAGLIAVGVYFLSQVPISQNPQFISPR